MSKTLHLKNLKNEASSISNHLSPMYCYDLTRLYFIRVCCSALMLDFLLNWAWAHVSRKEEKRQQWMLRNDFFFFFNIYSIFMMNVTFSVTWNGFCFPWFAFGKMFSWCTFIELTVFFYRSSLLCFTLRKRYNILASFNSRSTLKNLIIPEVCPNPEVAVHHLWLQDQDVGNNHIYISHT